DLPAIWSNRWTSKRLERSRKFVRIIRERVEIFPGNHSLVGVGSGFSSDGAGFRNGDFLFNRHAQRQINRLPSAGELHFLTFGRRETRRYCLQPVFSWREPGKIVSAFAVCSRLLLSAAGVSQSYIRADNHSTKFISNCATQRTACLVGSDECGGEDDEQRNTTNVAWEISKRIHGGPQ